MNEDQILQQVDRPGWKVITRKPLTYTEATAKNVEGALAGDPTGETELGIQGPNGETDTIHVRSVPSDQGGARGGMGDIVTKLPSKNASTTTAKAPKDMVRDRYDGNRVVEEVADGLGGWTAKLDAQGKPVYLDLPSGAGKSPEQQAADLANTQATTAHTAAETANIETPAERATRTATQEAGATQRTAMSNQSSLAVTLAASEARMQEQRDKIKAEMEAGITLPKAAELQLQNMYAEEKARIDQQIAQENEQYQGQITQANAARQEELTGPRQNLTALSGAAERASKPGFDTATAMGGWLQKLASTGVQWDPSFITPYKEAYGGAVNTYNSAMQTPMGAPAPGASAIPPPPSMGAPTPMTAATGATTANINGPPVEGGAPTPRDVPNNADELPRPNPDEEDPTNAAQQ